jgi:hypothetical protein
MSCFQFSNLFPLMKTSIISFMITLFELSTGVFYIFNVANRSLGLGREQLFTIYTGCGAFTLVTALLLWPDSPYEAPSDEGEEGAANGEVEEGQHHQDEGTQVGSALIIPYHSPTSISQLQQHFLFQICSMWVYSVVLCVCASALGLVCSI